jgi:hypothetical protein
MIREPIASLMNRVINRYFQYCDSLIRKTLHIR